jgi:hypothetical protein
MKGEMFPMELGPEGAYSFLGSWEPKEEAEPEFTGVC